MHIAVHGRRSSAFRRSCWVEVVENARTPTATSQCWPRRRRLIILYDLGAVDVVWNHPQPVPSCERAKYESHARLLRSCNARIFQRETPTPLRFRPAPLSHFSVARFQRFQRFQRFSGSPLSPHRVFSMSSSMILPHQSSQRVVQTVQDLGERRCHDSGLLM